MLLLNQKDGSRLSPQELRNVFNSSQEIMSKIQSKANVVIDKKEVYKDKSGFQPGYKLLETFYSTYFYHSDKCFDSFESWIIDSVSREVGFGNNLILSVLRQSKNHAKTVAILLNEYMSLLISNNQQGMALWLILDLFNHEVYPAKLLSQIISELEPFIEGWNLEQKQHAIKCLFSTESDEKKEKTRQILKRSKGARRLAKELVSGAEGRESDGLKSLLSVNLSPTYKLPTGGETQFEDINFKLIVLDELMFVKQVLKPKFDISKFVKEYDHREIKNSGYEIIPEALKYMEGIKVPDNLMLMITDLNYYAAREIYGNLVPFWNGEDEVFEVNSLKDVNKFKNLQKIGGINKKLISSSKSLLEFRDIKIEECLTDG